MLEKETYWPSALSRFTQSRACTQTCTGTQLIVHTHTHNLHNLPFLVVSQMLISFLPLDSRLSTVGYPSVWAHPPHYLQPTELAHKHRLNMLQNNLCKALPFFSLLRETECEEMRWGWPRGDSSQIVSSYFFFPPHLPASRHNDKTVPYCCLSYLDEE